MCLACNFMNIKTKCCCQCNIRKVCTHACQGMNTKVEGKIVKQIGEECGNSEKISYDIMCPFYAKVKRGESCALSENTQKVIDNLECTLEAIDIVTDMDKE